MFINGMDVSMLAELEEAGAVYRYQGKEEDIFAIFNKTGINAVRLRVWKDPYDEDGNAYGGGTNDLQTTIKLAQRVIANGLAFILDFHYSDFWTDPGKQRKPKAWKELSGKELEDALYHYTLAVLHTLAENRCLPTYVQIGNEITNGLLWPDGHVDHAAAMAGLLASGIRAVREFDADIRILLHLDFGTDNPMYRRWFQIAKDFELDYDIIGMSYYPFWNGSLEELIFNMNDIAEFCGKEIIIAETAHGYTTDNLGSNGMIFNQELAEKVPYPATKEGQKEYLKALIDTINRVEREKGIGFIYWEPAWLPIPECTWAKGPGCRYLEESEETSNSWANLAMFDQDGNANPVFELFNKP